MLARCSITAAIMGLASLHLLPAPALAQDAKKVALNTSGWGKLTGKVVYAREKLPVLGNIKALMQKHLDAKTCLAAPAQQLADQSWVIDPKTKGVASVLVYLKAPKGSYFPVHDDDKKRTDVITMDQPFCAFVPHMVGLFPEYFDGTKMTPTGQKFKVLNSAPVLHNVRVVGDPTVNPGLSVGIPAKGFQDVKLGPQRLPVIIQCDIHPWMKAWAGVFDHPYFAVTKEDGSFEMPRVPAGAELAVMAWHEEVGYVLGREGKALTLKKGDNTLDIEIK